MLAARADPEEKDTDAPHEVHHQTIPSFLRHSLMLNV
jgi:hypothetical protein